MSFTLPYPFTLLLHNWSSQTCTSSLGGASSKKRMGQEGLKTGGLDTVHAIAAKSIPSQHRLITLFLQINMPSIILQGMFTWCPFTPTHIQTTVFLLCFSLKTYLFIQAFPDYVQLLMLSMFLCCIVFIICLSC